MKVIGEAQLPGADWLKSNLEAVLTNLKIKESAILEFPALKNSTSKKECFGLLNKVPFCFDPDRLYLGIQGEHVSTKRSFGFAIQRRFVQ